MPDSVAGIALRNGLVFVARRRPGGSMGGKWEFPGGKLEPGETPEETLVREFREELGLEVRPGALLGESEFENEGVRFRLRAYRVEFDGEPSFLAEHQDVRWLSRTELEDLDLAPSDRSLLRFLPG
ncbi:MAG TPA: (deoxy)nucleoside triphosphate pyrophosphohydrolase [Spirochaetia bacterium]|nr:(deoxy)nucleoside triphosphate pyrophosphohydrolase [Spirochaetales bacterium]HRY81854.1 (deoxy)nucleoside triphosphate pyrophosphohydrolase [Spirochaetia bacterium]